MSTNESTDLVTTKVAEVIHEVSSIGALELSNKHHGKVADGGLLDDSWKEKIHKPRLSSRMTQLLRNANII